MIVYDKLMNILSERQMNKRQLSEAIGIKANTMSALSKNRNVNMETINRICEYLHVQPSDIMEWIPDAEYEKANEEIASIEQQIAELEAKKKQLQGK